MTNGCGHLGYPAPMTLLIKHLAAGAGPANGAEGANGGFRTPARRPWPAAPRPGKPRGAGKARAAGARRVAASERAHADRVT
ncbi:hypothetical protein Amsp01_052860 [Amycolatopsis sp. NBRC 101858]|nr:hypothetical protein Amsp01_052860 [Amycolatopsis sp. NBRC 101858]